MNATRIGALITALVIAVVLGLTWVLGASPLLSQASAADSDRAAVEAANAAQEVLLAEARAEYERIDELEAELAALRVSIPGVVDPEFVYALLAGYASGTGARVDGIELGEARPYGGADVEGAEATATDGAAAQPGLFTVPVTITFADGVASDPVLAFAWALQRGPRLFLVTSIAGGDGGDGSGGGLYTISAYMFVVYDPVADPGEAVETLADLSYVAPRLVPWTPADFVPEVDEESSAGDEDADATESTPTPSTTPAPEPSPTP